MSSGKWEKGRMRYQAKRGDVKKRRVAARGRIGIFLEASKSPARCSEFDLSAMTW